MNGLLKSNYFAACASGKTFAVFMLLSGVFVVAVVSQPLLVGYMLLGMIGFSVNSMAGVGKEYASKWGKYKLTAPVKKADIIKSYFISLLLWLLIGLLFAGSGMGLSWAFHGRPFDRGIDVLTSFALGIGMSLFTGAFFFPLFHLGGEEKGGVFLAVSFLCAAGIALGIVSAINFYLDPGPATIIFGAVILLVCSSLAFAFSYPLTVGIFRKREY